MDSSSSKAEAVKPVILKAGIPLAIAVAGFIVARFVARRDSSNKASVSEDDQVNSSESNSDTALACMNDEDDTDLIENSEIQENHDHEEEIISLRSQLEELQKRGIELEMQFIRYRDLNEQESLLMELKSLLMLEKAYSEFFQREASSMEAENKRLKDLVIIYLKVLEQIQGLRSENGLLQRKIKRFMKRSKEQSRIIREKNHGIDVKERELLRCLDELETKNCVKKKLEDEVKELKAILDELQEQKNELSSKLSSESEIEYGGITRTIEDYKQLLSAYEDLQRDRAEAAKELMNLRWSYACLRHELTINQINQEQDQENKTHLDQTEFQEEDLGYKVDNGLVFDQDLSCSAVTLTGNGEDHRVYSKRRRLLKRLKKWV